VMAESMMLRILKAADLITSKIGCRNQESR
jgi:hypothetical protein